MMQAMPCIAGTSSQGDMSRRAMESRRSESIPYDPIDVLRILLRLCHRRRRAKIGARPAGSGCSRMKPAIALHFEASKAGLRLDHHFPSKRVGRSGYSRAVSIACRAIACSSGTRRWCRARVAPLVFVGSRPGWRLTCLQRMLARAACPESRAALAHPGAMPIALRRSKPVQAGSGQPERREEPDRVAPATVH